MKKKVKEYIVSKIPKTNLEYCLKTCRKYFCYGHLNRLDSKILVCRTSKCNYEKSKRFLKSLGIWERKLKKLKEGKK
jgi:hypothetical protein